MPITTLPLDVTAAILSELDGDSVSLICLALSCHHLYEITRALVLQGKPLRTLQLPFHGYRYIHQTCSTPHNTLRRSLWQYLNRRCVYCGIHEEVAKDWNSETQSYVFKGHVCTAKNGGVMRDLFWERVWGHDMERSVEEMEGRMMERKILERMRNGFVEGRDGVWWREMRGWLGRREGGWL